MKSPAMWAPAPRSLNIGLATLPCLVPLEIGGKSDLADPQLAYAYWSSYTVIMTRTTIGGTPFSRTFVNRVLNRGLSKIISTL